MSTFRFGKRSLANLDGVHAHLVIVATTALLAAPYDFTVTEGLRSKARQKALLEAGASQTMNSRHLTGHAIDIAVLVEGQVRWEWELYRQLSEIFYAAAQRHGIAITWGGEWKSRDGPHYQLHWSAYPVAAEVPA